MRFLVSIVMPVRGRRPQPPTQFEVDTGETWFQPFLTQEVVASTVTE